MNIFKYVVSILSVVILVSCGGESGEKRIELNGDYHEITLKSDWIHTTVALISFEGKCDCDLKIRIERSLEVDFKPGAIKYSKWVEWYTGPRKISFYSKGCTKGSYVILKYKFRHDLI